MTEEEYKSLPPGWSSKESADALESLAMTKYNTVIELGSYVGRSSVILARHSGQVHCVDTWNGRYVSEESVTRTGIAHKSMIYDSFLEHTKQFPNITSERLNFNKFVETSTLRAELIFIDAGPKTDIADKLIEHAWKHADKCIAGYHYYEDHRTVTDSVNAFARRLGLTVQVDRCLWKILKE